MAITAGLYEFRSVLLTTMALDVAGGSAVKGGNIQLYGANDTNAQKFWVVEETVGHYSIQNAQSRLYMDVAAGSAANGTNIQQWTDNDSRAQRWSITETGETVTILGVTCPVVVLYSYVDGAGATWVADVTRAMTTNGANVQLHTANGTPAQQFALYPTTLLDTQMPAPALLGWANGFSDVMQQVQIMEPTLYPGWALTEAWASLSGHGFQVQHRSRLLPVNSATYTAWSEYTAWEDVTASISGQVAKLEDGLVGNFDAEQYKAMEYDFRVRAIRTGDGGAYHSPSSAMTLRAVDLPSVSVTGAYRTAGLTPGVRIAFTSDYTGGATMVRVVAIEQYPSWDVAPVNLLAKPIVTYGHGAEFDVLIPFANFSQLPALGLMVVDYELGTDQYLYASYVGSESTHYANDTSCTLTVTGTLTWEDDATAVLDISYTGSSGPNLAMVSVYLSAGGEVLELAEAGTGRRYVVPYPFGVDATWTAIVQGISAWGVASGTISADDPHKVKPCHAWTWDGGSFALEVDTEPLVTKRTIKADYTDYQLSGRTWHDIKFADTMESQFSATGVLVGGLTASDKAALLALVHARNAVYRSPSGEVAHVGVLEVQYESGCDVTRVTVTMAQVTP